VISKARNFIKRFDEATIDVDGYLRVIQPNLARIFYNWALPLARRWGYKYTSTQMLIRELNNEFLSGKYPMPIKWIREEGSYRPNVRTRQREKRQGVEYDIEILSNAFVTFGGEVHMEVFPSASPQTVLDNLPDIIKRIMSMIRHELVHSSQLARGFQGGAYGGSRIGKPMGIMKPLSGFEPRHRRAERNPITGKPIPRTRNDRYMTQTNEISAYAIQFVELFMQHRYEMFFGKKQIPVDMEYIYKRYFVYGKNSPIFKRFLKLSLAEATRRGIDMSEFEFILENLSRVM